MKRKRRSRNINEFETREKCERMKSENSLTAACRIFNLVEKFISVHSQILTFIIYIFMSKNFSFLSSKKNVIFFSLCDLFLLAERHSMNIICVCVCKWENIPLINKIAFFAIFLSLIYMMKKIRMSFKVASLPLQSQYFHTRFYISYIKEEKMSYRHVHVDNLS